MAATAQPLAGRTALVTGASRGIGRAIAEAFAASGAQAAVVQLTRQLAAEMAPGVRVNAIAPGLVKTDMARELWEGREQEQGRRIPLGRLGEPADIASAAVFLASDAASWITGHTLMVDGGAMLAATITG